tara:strand:+ start:4000 stop:4611 length:612 start_codon:yes stop_codon:yes gene_type:complete
MENNIVPKQMQEVMMEGAIPGQSLTNSPDQAYSWEGKPKYTSLKKAREDIFLNLLKPDKLQGVQKLLMNEVSVNAIAEMALTDGFRTGKFNPDMMLNLLEPTMYMIMAIAEKSGIEPVVDSEGDEDEEENPEVTEEKRSYIKEGGRFRDAVVSNINPASVGGDIQQRLESLDSEKVRQSILQKPQPQTQPQTQSSLLGADNGR